MPAARTQPAATPSNAAPRPQAAETPSAAAPAALTNPPAPAPDSEEARLAAAAVRTGTETSLDGVIDKAFDREQAEKERARNAPPPLPVTPSRDDVIKAMNEKLPAIRACAEGQRGLATAAMSLSSDGSVQIVGLTGPPFAGTDRGHCMEAVLMSARVPPFKRPTVRLQYPFSLQ